MYRPVDRPSAGASLFQQHMHNAVQQHVASHQEDVANFEAGARVREVFNTQKRKMLSWLRVS